MGPTLDVLRVANWWAQAIVHVLAYVTFTLSLIHGLMAGSGTGSPWALAFYAAALRWEDVDLTGKPSITVRRSADTRTKTRVSTTKTGKERKITSAPTPSRSSRHTAPSSAR
ncbi:MAG: hypothetical protein M3317_00370 [Actinomycetota bacterium]|nr:hypothetical protein [Actinomycetota bacterium]